MNRPVKHCRFKHEDHQCEAFRMSTAKGKQNQVAGLPFTSTLVHWLLVANYHLSRLLSCPLLCLSGEHLSLSLITECLAVFQQRAGSLWPWKDSLYHDALTS